ncbi:MAG TPA: hypothetical protein VN787_07655 [Steroidobacteraceae bacterium]|nr:hypothetical protein [Steroidobacteraceae bacterium]
MIHTLVDTADELCTEFGTDDELVQRCREAIRALRVALDAGCFPRHVLRRRAK